VEWFLGYMLESCQDSRGNNRFPYGLLISRILKDIGIDLSKYPAKEGSGSRKGDSNLNQRLLSKDIPSINDFGDTCKASVVSLLKEALDIKVKLVAVVDDVHQVQLSLAQYEGVEFFNLFIKQVDSAAARFELSDNELIVTVQNSYASLSKRTEKSYHSFPERVINTCKYFLGRS
ncbi:hypothetical protein HAX54_035304, partial [Datura stramonium]|nr:hypothetical protein [Datura stramonium]